MTVLYHVTPEHPREHLYRVRCTVSEPDPAGQVFHLPSWIRGSYLVRDFAKHVLRLQASSEGRDVAVERLDKRSLRCAPVRGALQLDYQVYAYDESVRKAWLDMRRGFFNGSSLFYCPAGREGAAFELVLERPPEPQLSPWRVATTLPALEVDEAGFGRYRADDYEDLIDHPVELGTYRQLDFDVDGVPHALVLSGRVELDEARVLNDLTRICRVERELFRHEPKLARYLFLTNVVASGYGGLEHRSSTALICARGDFPQVGDARFSRDYRGFLGLCSHEYFHLWNVKRIAPQRLLDSDLGAEAYTRDLWHYEGVTSYYDDLFLLRAGILAPDSYLDVVAETATRLQRTPGRTVQTLADASFEAWIKHYQPDENTPNQAVSYYVKGALVALCLDLRLRRDSAITLDDVMRALWRDYGARGRGVPDGTLEALAQQLSGLDLQAFFDHALRSTAELPLAEYLADFGVQAVCRVTCGDTDVGGRCTGPESRVSLGLKLRASELRVAQVFSDGPAAQAGLAAGDQLVAVDGLRLSAATWAARLQSLTPGRPYSLHLFRNDELLEVSVVPQASPADTWTLTLDTKASAEALRRRQAWLGC